MKWNYDSALNQLRVADDNRFLNEPTVSNGGQSMSVCEDNVLQVNPSTERGSLDNMIQGEVLQSEWKLCWTAVDAQQ
jgi:hypothetical protein